MDRRARLWDALRWRFSEPEGTWFTPELRVCGLGPEALVRGWSRVLRGADALRSDQAIWDARHDRWAPASELPEAGALVASGRTAAFRVDVAGVRDAAGGQLPDVGLTVAEGELSFDLVTGPAWTPEAVAGLIDLVLELRAMDPRATLALEHRATPALVTQVVGAIDAYAAARTSVDG